jgi:RecA-family ATPase
MTRDLVTTARRWLQAGYSVIPVSSNKRAYQEWKPYQVRPYQLDEVERTFSDPRAEKLAIVCGYGGLFCFDFDPDKDGIAAEPFDLEGDFYRPWADTAEGLGVELRHQPTPSGGRHLLMVCPEPIGNQKLARVKATPGPDGRVRTHTVIETRGAGGYFLLYDLGLDPHSIPSITDEQFQALLEAAVLLDRAPETAESHQAAQQRRGGGKAANATREGLVGWFNERYKTSDVLERNHYRRVHHKYLAPSSTSGNPGVTIFTDSAGLELCYSHHSDELGDGHAHDAFDTMKLLEFGGNFEAALGHVKQLKDGDRYSFGQVKASPPPKEAWEASASRPVEKDFAAAMRNGLTVYLEDDHYGFSVPCPTDLKARVLAHHKTLIDWTDGSVGATGETAKAFLYYYWRLLNSDIHKRIQETLPFINSVGASRARYEASENLSTNRGKPVRDATTICAQPMSTNTKMSTNNDDLSSNSHEEMSTNHTPVPDGKTGKIRGAKNDLSSNHEHKLNGASSSQKRDLSSNSPQHQGFEVIRKWGERDKPAPVQWLVHHLIQDNAENLLAGEPGVGKSWISGDLAVAVATGSTFLERHTQQGPVLIINFDDPSESLPRMFAERAARGREYDFGDLPLYYWQPEESRPAPPEGIITPAVFEFLLEQCSLIRPRFIIVDSFSSAFPGLDGNKGPDVLRSFEALRQLRVAAGKPCSILLVDHTPKATLQDSKRRGVSGSQQKHAKTRTVHIIRHVDPGEVNGDDVLEWEVFKANAAPRQEPFGIDREMDGLLNTAKLNVRPLPKSGQGAKNDRAAKAAVTYLKSRAGEFVSRQDLLKEIISMANVSMATARRGLHSNELIDHPQVRLVEMGGRGNPTGFMYEPESDSRVSLFDQLREALQADATKDKRYDPLREYYRRADQGDDDAKDAIDNYLARDEVRQWLNSLQRDS